MEFVRNFPNSDSGTPEARQAWEMAHVLYAVSNSSPSADRLGKLLEASLFDVTR